MEQTQPGIYHIHIDAINISQNLYDFVTKELKFYDSDFNGHPQGYKHFEPQKHLTLKLDTEREYIDCWNKLNNFAKQEDLKGYLEAEFIPKDDFIPYREYQDIPIPFKIKRRRLKNEEKFRETEIHLTFEKNKSHPHLIRKLLESGLYGAYIPKDRGDFLVLTIQGFVKDIVPLHTEVKKYIEKSGGAYMCTLKEERAINYKLFGITCEDLPEIADKIIYTE